MLPFSCLRIAALCCLLNGKLDKLSFEATSHRTNFLFKLVTTTFICKHKLMYTMLTAFNWLGVMKGIPFCEMSGKDFLGIQ